MSRYRCAIFGAVLTLAAGALLLWAEPVRDAMVSGRVGMHDMCVAFRSTGRSGTCDPHAFSSAWRLRAVPCEHVIDPTESGYCDCGEGGHKAHVWCDHSPFTCAEVCANPLVAPREDWRAFAARDAEGAAARRAALPPLRGRGIVTVVGGGYTIDGLLLVAALRELGCALPVEFWFNDAASSSDGAALADPAVRATLARLGVTLRGFGAAQRERRSALGDLADASDATQFAYAAEQRGHGSVPVRAANAKRGYLYKTAALSLTRFEEALFLDTDVTPLSDPTFLFDAPGYARTGALLWPDFDRDVAADRWTHGLLRRGSQTFWNAVGGRPRAYPASLPTIETGQMVLRRPSESPAIRLAHFFLRTGYHYYDHYMIRYAHLLLEQRFHVVETPVGWGGYTARSRGGAELRAAPPRFCGHTMLQATPRGAAGAEVRAG
jgi:hypothetical protein